jgi:hypothetical protein
MSQEIRVYEATICTNEPSVIFSKKNELRPVFERKQVVLKSDHDQEIAKLKAEVERLKNGIKLAQKELISITSSRDAWEDSDDLADKAALHLENTIGKAVDVPSYEQLQSDLAAAKEALSQLITRYKQQDYGEVYLEEAEKVLEQLDKG